MKEWALDVLMGVVAIGVASAVVYLVSLTGLQFEYLLFGFFAVIFPWVVGGFIRHVVMDK